jgi:hypothetical protein
MEHHCGKQHSLNAICKQENEFILSLIKPADHPSGGKHNHAEDE